MRIWVRGLNFHFLLPLEDGLFSLHFFFLLLLKKKMLCQLVVGS